jgi:prevent-host-death family protein
MQVAVTELRAHLSDWLGRVREGEEVVITERGRPVARLLAHESIAPADTTGDEATRLAQRLQAEGLILEPARARRPRALAARRVRGRGSVSDIVSEQRS